MLFTVVLLGFLAASPFLLLDWLVEVADFLEPEEDFWAET